MLSFRVAACLIAPLVLVCGWQAKGQTPRVARASRNQPRTAREDFALTRENASHFAALALRCVRKEYPNKIEHVLDDATQVQAPRALHPAFYGCYDWHSSVHGHCCSRTC